jgi:hypothetical protein
MKFWKITGFLTGLVVAVVITQKYRRKLVSSKRSDTRYTVDDLMTDQDL